MGQPRITRVVRLTLVTANLDATARFFEQVFDAIAIRHGDGDAADSELLGLAHARVRETVLRIGAQEVALISVDPPGRPYPAESTSTDLWFQHFALIVSDMEAAHARLASSGQFTPISTQGPERLPASSGSVTAFKFRDVEGHPLEFLSFPVGTGPDIWQAKRGSALFLGIDHSAIAVSDTPASIAFFQDVLGLQLGEQTTKQGPEQSRMDAVPDAKVTVSGLNPATQPPHVELLGYEVGARRAIPEGTTSADLAATHFVLETDDLETLVEDLTAHRIRFVSPGVVGLADGTAAIMVLDPDGHRFVIRQAPR